MVKGMGLVSFNFLDNFLSIELDLISTLNENHELNNLLARIEKVLALFKSFRIIIRNAHYFFDKLKCPRTALNKVLNNGGLKNFSDNMLAC